MAYELDRLKVSSLVPDKGKFLEQLKTSVRQEIERILTREQLAKYRTLSFQLLVRGMLDNPQVRGQIGLTTEQDKARLKIDAEMDSDKGQLPAGNWLLNDIVRQTSDRLLKILSPDQQGKLHEIIDHADGIVPGNRTSDAKMPGTVSKSVAGAIFPPDTPLPIDKEKTAQIATLEALVSAVESNFSIGYAKLSDLYDAQDKLLDAQLDAAKKAERIAIWEKLLQTRQEMEKKAEALVKQRETGPDEGAKSDLLRARAERQKAEIGLAEEKARGE